MAILIGCAEASGCFSIYPASGICSNTWVAEAATGIHRQDHLKLEAQQMGSIAL